MKVEKLTEQQLAKCPEYVKKYVDLGLSTKPLTDKSKAQITEIIGKVYEAGGLPAPKQVLFFQNPVECSVFASKNGAKNVKSFCYGSLEAGWLSFYSYFINEVPEVTGLDKIKPLIELLGLCSYWLPYANSALVSQNPTSIMKNANGLHNADGPALTYAGDFDPIYSMNGIIMPKWVIETPAKDLDCTKIMKIINVDQRREALRKVGPENLMKSLKSKTLDSQEVTNETKGKFGITNLKRDLNYSLLEFNFGDGMLARYLKMDNPSVDLTHIEGVPNTCNTVFDALAFRNQRALETLGIKTWKPPTQLT